MLRLMQGDVGCGKTLVAALAATHAIESGRQVASDGAHGAARRSACAEFPPLVRAAWGHAWRCSRGGLTARARAAALARHPRGRGRHRHRHACSVPGGRGIRVAGARIVDEQHRFGVHQRLSLREKGAHDGHRPHQLIMTATPIPRTLAMTAYADLDVSVIDELPPGRTPVTTVALSDARRDEVVVRHPHRVPCGAAGLLGVPADRRVRGDALSGRRRDRQGARGGIAGAQGRGGTRHACRRPRRSAPCGRSRRARSICWWRPPSSRSASTCRMPRSWSSRTRSAWGSRSCTSCAAASAAGNMRAPALLLYRSPLSPLARERLAVMRDTNDGFEVARRDLELRGPGEFLGTRQTGLAQMRVADLARDADLLPRVQIAAERMLRGLDRECDAVGKTVGRTWRAIRPRRLEWRNDFAKRTQARSDPMAPRGAARPARHRGPDAPLAHRQGAVERPHEGRLRREVTRLTWSINGPACWAPIHKACLKVGDSAGLFRDEELACGGQVWVFAQTVVPDSTLCVHPWLGELGDSAVGEILSDSVRHRAQFLRVCVAAGRASADAPGRCANRPLGPRGCGRGDRGFRCGACRCSRRRRSCPRWATYPQGSEDHRPCGCRALAPNCCSGSPSAGGGSSIASAFIPGRRTSCRGFWARSATTSTSRA